MKAYFDTSAFGTIIFRDIGWEDVGRWIASNNVNGSISDFGWGEFVSAVGLRVRRDGITPARGIEILGSAPDYLKAWSRIAITPADIAGATTMLADFALALRLPEAIRAIARRIGTTLVSTDIRQVRAARALGIDAVNPLQSDGDLP